MSNDNNIDEEFSNITNTNAGGNSSPRRNVEKLKVKHRIFLWMCDGLENSSVGIKHNENLFTSTAQELISNGTSDPFIIETSRKLLVQQRIMDDTKARRRLEKWAKRVIICYLAFVGALVLLNGLSQLIEPWKELAHGFISDTVMTVILSTTTINIIGLGVIVLRGHFPNYSHDDKGNPINITYTDSK